MQRKQILWVAGGMRLGEVPPVRALRAPVVQLAALFLLVSMMLGCGALQGAPNPASGNYVSSSTAKLNFGTVVVGGSQSLITTITNNSRRSVTIQKASISGPCFSLVSPQMPLTLGGRQSVQLTVKCAPSAAGTISGSLALATTAAWATSPITLAGTAVLPGQISPAPVSLAFGSVVVGQAGTQSVNLTNSGSTSLTISQLSVSNSAFQLSGAALPLTLSPGQSASLNVSFRPQSAGAASATISATASASLSAGGSSAASAATTSANAGIAVAGTGLAGGQLAVSPASLVFASTQVGKTASQVVTLTSSGSSAVVINQAVASGSGFSLAGAALPMTLQPGQSAALNVIFSPTTAGSDSGSVTINSNGVTPSLTVALSGTASPAASPGAITANPTSLTFGNVQDGSSKTQTETLTNAGGSSLTISQASVSGSGFSLTGLDPPLTLGAGQSFTFGVQFAPQSAGNTGGSITLTSDASSTPAIPVSGTGTAAGQLTISPASLSFGNVTVGATQNHTATLAATGAAVTVSSASASSSEFTLSGISLPLTLAPGQSMPVTVQFTPQASGSATASASFTSNASVSTMTEALAGTGVPAPQHSVGLTWSSSSLATGYYVYRSAVSGGPYSKLTSSPDAATSYSDTAVQAGQTYFYVTSAVDQSGVESDYSNEVEAVIPSP